MVNSPDSKQTIIYLDSAYQNFPDAGPDDHWAIDYQKVTYYLNYEINIPLAGLYTDSMELVIKSLDNIYRQQYATTLFTQGNILMNGVYWYYKVASLPPGGKVMICPGMKR